MTRLFIAHTADAYALLREAAHEVWGLAELPEMARAAKGKPWFPGRPELCFNVSHSHSRSLCALSSGAVGADLETVRPRGAILPRKVLSPEEYRWFQGRGARWEDFYTLWTLKEAKVKLTGSGLDRPARTLSVPLLEPGQVEKLDGLVFTAYGGEGWRAALCSATDTALIEWCCLS